MSFQGSSRATVPNSDLVTTTLRLRTALCELLLSIIYFEFQKPKSLISSGTTKRSTATYAVAPGRARES
jgi:hypothetical protein